MKIAMSYFVKVPVNNVIVNVWLAAGKEIPEGAIVIEERPMLVPDESKVLRNKKTGEISSGHWLKNDSADNWEEIEEPKGEDNA